MEKGRRKKWDGHHTEAIGREKERHFVCESVRRCALQKSVQSSTCQRLVAQGNENDNNVDVTSWVLSR